jgi:predicted methyltransferase
MSDRMKLSSHLLALALLAGCGASQTAAQTAPVVGANAPAVAFGSIDAALVGGHRSAANRARDAHRHPRETLAFFGVQPGQTVVELSPGGGWYTEILAPLFHDQGQLVAAIPSTTGTRARYAANFQTFLTTRPDLYGNVRTVTLEAPAQVTLGPAQSADVVLTFRNLHGWINDGVAAQVFTAAFQVLKPGGVFGLVEHRANAGTDPATTARQGYVSEAATIALAEAAGFTLEERSEINANPRDTKDYADGVWALPPTLRGGDRDRERFVAIGESDRMTLRFRRPAAPAAR